MPSKRSPVVSVLFDSFCQILAYPSTAHKNGRQVLDVLPLVFAELPVRLLLLSVQPVQLREKILWFYRSYREDHVSPQGHNGHEGKMFVKLAVFFPFVFELFSVITGWPSGFG